MSTLQSAALAYRMNQVNNASPLDLLIMAYDAALIGCGQQNLERTIEALTILREAIDFSYDEDIAMGFFRLYQYCAELARQGEYDEAANLLRELRDTWGQVKAQFQPAQQTAPVASPYAQTPDSLQVSSFSA